MADFRGYAVEVSELLLANPQAHAAVQAAPELLAAIFRAAVAADSLREVCITALAEKVEREQAEADPETEPAEGPRVSVN